MRTKIQSLQYLFCFQGAQGEIQENREDKQGTKAFKISKKKYLPVTAEFLLPFKSS